ncbi:hypothetical protein IH992_25650 [Candidatus Poribacteria bacterium]|nr:hypothetical protein [Candidatus Poribacteria bacterium]
MDTPETIFDGAPPADDKPADDKPKGEDSSDEVKPGEGETDTTKVVDDKTGSDDTEAGKKDDAPPASKDETQVPLAALQEQRDKRQAVERERDDLLAKLNKSEKPGELTSVFDDEAKFRSELQNDFDSQLNNQRYNQSQFFVEQDIGKDVLATKVETFKTLAAANPALTQQMANAISPYHEMVTIVDQHSELAKMQDLPAYKAQLKAEAKAEVLAEMKAGSDDSDKLRDSISDSLAGDASVGKRDSAAVHTPKTAEEVYN